MDVTDRRILVALQRDGKMSINELAERVHLSPSACHRRVKILEEEGIIGGYAARLDREKLGLSVDVFVAVSLNSQAHEVLEAFEKAVAGVPDILECHLMAGQADYHLRLVVSDVAHYERLHRDRLSRLPHVAGMVTSFALRTVTEFRGYPVPDIG